MNIFYRKFSTGEVVAATGVSNATLQSWLKRGIIVGQKDSPIEGAGSPGAHRRYSFYNVMEIAIAKALLDAGMGEPREAFQAAISYAHVGCGEIPGIVPMREPSLPYGPRSQSYTLICAMPGRTRIIPWRPGKDPVANIWQEVGIAQAYGLVLLFANPVFDRVCTGLGYHPDDVLRLAYPTEEKN